MQVRKLMFSPIGIASVSTLLVGSHVSCEGKIPEKPNVIFILADDLGYMDVSYNDSGFYETPNIDAFSKKGMVFTNAYSANPLCSPTRASILTGLHPARVGITFPDCHFANEVLEKGFDPEYFKGRKWIGAKSLTRLKTEYFTLPEAFKENGYITGHFGKWHLGMAPYDPVNQGFDVDFPKWSWAPGPSKYLGPWKWGVNGSKDMGKENEHIEDRTTDAAIEFIKENKNQPFLLDYWAWSVHGPIQAKAELIEKYRKKIKPGYHQQNPVYAAMLETFDDNVGRILNAVKEIGLENKTIIIFYSDNGGVHYNLQKGDPATSNLPLRGGKATIYEGGTRVPCIVFWPGVTRPGTTSSQLISSIDWFPTLLEMTGNIHRSGHKFDGISIVPAMKGKKNKSREIYCHFPQGNPEDIEKLIGPGHQPSTYVRQGDWKLIRFYCDNPDQSDRYELYNLKTDLYEKTDLSGKHPEIVAKLSKLINKFLIDTEAVIPYANPEYVKK